MMLQSFSPGKTGPFWIPSSPGQASDRIPVIARIGAYLPPAYPGNRRHTQMSCHWFSTLWNHIKIPYKWLLSSWKSHETTEKEKTTFHHDEFPYTTMKFPWHSRGFPGGPTSTTGAPETRRRRGTLSKSAAVVSSLLRLLELRLERWRSYRWIFRYEWV